MNKQSIVYGVVGLLLGALFTGFVMANQNKQTPAQPQTIMNKENTSKHTDSPMSMQDMIDSLKGKTEDEFDKAFISGMIEHHQGAIDMAFQAKTNAKHDELKSMAEDIISAQTSEIDMMKQWQKDWGYTH